VITAPSAGAEVGESALAEADEGGAGVAEALVEFRLGEPHVLGGDGWWGATECQSSILRICAPCV